METTWFFSRLNHHKCLSYLFPLHFKTYVMGQRSLNFLIFSVRGSTLDIRIYGRQILVSKVVRGVERVLNLYVTQI